MNEEEIYESISKEIDNDEKKKGLWTKAFGESDGDENKAKSLYIKYRFDQIKDSQSDVLKGGSKETEGKNNKEEVKESISLLKREELGNKENIDGNKPKETEINLKNSQDNYKKQYDTFFYLKIIIVVEFILIFLGLIGNMKIDFLIMNLGWMVGISLWVYIYFVWKRTNSNLFIKLLISSVALLLSIVVPITFDMKVKEQQKKVWYLEAVNEAIRRYKEAENRASEDEKYLVVEEPLAEPIFLPLESFVVKLKGGKRFLKASIQLMLSEPGAATYLTVRMIKVKDIVLAELQKLSIEDVKKSDTREALRQRLIRAISQIFPIKPEWEDPKPIRKVLFEEFVIQ